MVLNNCVLGPYTAGQDEVAIIDMDLSLAFDNLATFAFLAPVVEVLGGDPTFASSFFSLAATSNGVAHVSHRGSYRLTPGQSYTFSMGAQIQDAGTPTLMTCHHRVMIVRATPPL
jgi:hypothetical protein